MGSAVLGDAIGAIRDWSVAEGKESKKAPTGKAGDGFGSLVFGDSEQQKRLPKAAYQALRKTITRERIPVRWAALSRARSRTGRLNTVRRTTRTGSSR
jgi:hypothetical protein